MRIKSNNRYFDFNDAIEIEKQWKLFESLGETVGDFSYQFELPPTANNLSMLGFPSPDAAKSIYKSVPCDIIDEDGIPFYSGSIRVESKTDKAISCSYFSGNFNWISFLSGYMSELDLSNYSRESTRTNIRNSWQNDEGTIFPLLDTGLLTTRSAYGVTMVDDYTLCIFVKTLFELITKNTGVRFTGDLFKDPAFDSMILCRNTRGKKPIEDRSSFANLTSDQAFIATTGGTTVTAGFDDDSTLPYYDGAKNNYNTSGFEYTADVAMRALLEVEFVGINYASSSLNALGYFIEVNGVNVAGYGVVIGVGSVPGTGTGAMKFSAGVKLEAGDIVNVRVNAGTISGTTSVTIKAGSTFKVTPLYMLYTEGVDLVPPKWTMAQFVTNIMNLFCCLSDYDPGKQTVTINFFKDLSTKDPIDLSAHVTLQESDFQEVVSSYFKSSTLSYQESDDEEVKGYNTSAFVKYGAGAIIIDNDYIEDKGSMVEVDFTSPVSYINPTFRCSMERVPFFTSVQVGSLNFDRVVYAGGPAAFHLPSTLDFVYIEEGDLVRIEDSTNDLYNGEYYVEDVTGTIGSSVGRHIILGGLRFSSDATGKAVKLSHRSTNSDAVYVLWQTKYDADQVPKYSGRASFIISEKGGATIVDDVAYPYFNMLNTGNTINDQYKQSLSFGDVENDLSYQRTLIDTYWKPVERILNDPVKLFEDGLIPKDVFLSLTPLRPIRIRTKDTDGQYYLNRITGYQNRSIPCTLEIVKLA